MSIDPSLCLRLRIDSGTEPEQESELVVEPPKREILLLSFCEFPAKYLPYLLLAIETSIAGPSGADLIPAPPSALDNPIVSTDYIDKHVAEAVSILRISIYLHATHENILAATNTRANAIPKIRT